MNKHYYQLGYGGLEMLFLGVIAGAVMYFLFFPKDFKNPLLSENSLTQFCRPYLEEDGSIKPDAPEIMLPTYDASVVRRGQPFPKMNPNDIQPFRLIKGNVPLKSSDLHENYSDTYFHNANPNDMHCATYMYNGDTHSHFCQWIHEPLEIATPLSKNGRYVVMYPAPYSDGNSTDRYIGASDPYNSEVGNDEVIRYGDHNLVFLLHIDKDNRPVVLTKATYEGHEGFEFYAFDVYQQVKPDDHLQPVNPVPESVLKCIDKPYDAGEYELLPVIEKSPDKKQEQLGWFTPKKIVAGDTWYEPACKPAINLYPEKETLINVKVAIPHGFLTYTDPVYPENQGWSVLAKPSGRLTYLGSNLADSKGKTNYINGAFPYLYYEGKIADAVVTKPDTGFVKKQEELEVFFDELLPELGLNSKEAKEFKDYWLKALPKSPYYFIGILPQEQLNKNEPLTISPKEDTMIRVRLYFEALETPRSVKAPEIENSLPALPGGRQGGRQGFTVVDWGGMVKADKDHPFTCVQ